MKLAPTAPLPARLLADSLRIPVRYPKDIPNLESGTLQCLLVDDPTVWSAITIAASGRHMILLNSSHSPARQSSSLMHELAHLIIGHPPVRGLVTDDGLLMLNCYDKDKEDEANWLSGALLLPRDALIAIRRSRMSVESAADHYEASVDMVRFRMQVTGVDFQMVRARKHTR